MLFAFTLFIMVAITIVLSVLIFVFYDNTTNPVMAVCIIVLGLVFCLILPFKDVAYNEGQIDALNGKQKFKLITKVVEVQETVKKTVIVPELK